MPFFIFFIIKLFKFDIFAKTVDMDHIIWTNPFTGRFTWFNRKINGNFFLAFSKDVFFIKAKIQSYMDQSRPK